MKAPPHGLNLTQLRKQLYLNQKDFWGAIGVTQSAGSRYESGKTIPVPVQELIHLVYIEQLQLEKVNRDDMGIALFLKHDYPELYSNLKKAMHLVYKLGTTQSLSPKLTANENQQTGIYQYALEPSKINK